MNIVGISAGYHDAACCILRDGVLVAAAQEERFSRIKNDSALPTQALRYCLSESGLTIADIDCLAFYEDSRAKLERQLWMGMAPGASSDRRRAVRDRLLAEPLVEQIRSQWGWDGDVEVVDHHLSHAASSFLFSGFDEAAILTADGVGDWPTTTYNAGTGIGIRRFEQVDYPHSLGLFYSAITGYLGFEVNEGEYKVMALASYGGTRFVDRIGELVHSAENGQFRLDLRFFDFLSRDRMYSDELCALLGRGPRQPESPIDQFHLDVARGVQTVLEEIMLEKVRYLHQQYPSTNLCMAGGVALNIVMNRRCMESGPFSNLFVQPAAGDAGGCIGAAAVAQTRRTETRPSARQAHVYLGPAISPDESRHLLERSGIAFKDYARSEQALIEDVTERLIQGEIVGWACGRMEFGPRALGARSILADPRRPEMRDKINAVVKLREAFRPFAPAVLASHAHEHFDLRALSPFMLETCRVTSPLSLPAITHVDGSARIQTVEPSIAPRFAALLSAFERRTGCPILLNTSFNLRGEPIVCTAFDALSCFVRSGLDAVVVGDCVVQRAAIPPVWEFFFERGTTSQRHRRSDTHAVYTFL